MQVTSQVTHALRAVVQAPCSMLMLSRASRASFADASKAAQSITECASLLRWWHNFQLTSSFSSARTPINTAASLATHVCQSGAPRCAPQAQQQDLPGAWLCSPGSSYKKSVADAKAMQASLLQKSPRILTVAVMLQHPRLFIASKGSSQH